MSTPQETQSGSSGDNPNRDVATITHNSSWDRLVHCDTLLGYSMKLCILVGIPALCGLSMFPWLEQENGVSVFSEYASLVMFAPL